VASIKAGRGYQDSRSLKVWAIHLAKTVILACVYAGAAKVGLMMDPVGGFATLVWPSSGIALAALLVFGKSLWPGVFIGATAINAFAGASPLVALGIGVGNTLEAALGAWALQRGGLRFGLDRQRDVLLFLAAAVLASPVAAATIGAGSVLLGNDISGAMFADAWTAWWMGDAMGNLMVAPVALTWSVPRTGWWSDGRRTAEGLLFGAAFLVATAMVWGPWMSAPHRPYQMFPLVIWGALRFGPRGVVTPVFVMSLAAIGGTAIGWGPFVHSTLHAGLFHLQAFLAVLAVTGLVLAAAITEREEAERRARESEQRLTEAVGVRDEFMSIASHELRTPVSALVLQLAGLKRLMSDGRLTGGGDGRLAQGVDRAARQTHRLTKLIEDLLDVSRITTGRIHLEVEPFDLCALVRDVVERFTDTAVRAKCNLGLQVGVSEIVGSWDRLRIEQILTNLLSNAVKYGAGKPIEVVVEATAGEARIVVRDQGIGIAPADVTRVFGRFERAVSSRHFGGLGLGLYIAHQIAKAHGGSIRVDSAAGAGSTFTVVLPWSPPGPPSQAVAS